MEIDINFFEARITWFYKGILHSDRVSYLAKDYTEFMGKINHDYEFADEYTVNSIMHVTYINEEAKYIRGERVL